MGRKIEVDEDELEFILKEYEEFLADYDLFARKRFGLSAGIERLRGVLGKTSDPDKTPVRPAFPSRKMTRPGGHKIE